MSNQQSLPPEAQLRKALVAAQAAITSASKDAKNNHGGFDYASKESIAASIKAVCDTHGLAFSMRGPISLDGDEKTGTATWTAALTHEGGAQEEWPVVWAVDYTQKGMSREQRLGSAMSYALKNEILSLFNIPRGDPQPDMDSQDHRHAGGGRAAQRPPNRAARAERTVGQPERKSVRRKHSDQVTPAMRRHAFLVGALSEESLRGEVVKQAKAMGLAGSLQTQELDTLEDLYVAVLPPPNC